MRKKLLVLIIVLLCISSALAWYNPTRAVGKVWGLIEPWQDTAISVDKSSTSVYNLSFRVNEEVKNAGLTFHSLELNPTSEDIENYYEFFEIEADRLDKSITISRKIRFKIKKTWLNSSGLSENSVLLKVFKTNWKDVKTSIIKRDSAFVYYLGEPDSFGNFAVVVKENSLEVAEQEKQVREDTAKVKAELEQKKLEEQRKKQAVEEKKKNEGPVTTIIKKPTSIPNWVKPLIGFLIIFAILIVFYKYRKNVTKRFSGFKKDNNIEKKEVKQEKKVKKKFSLKDLFKKKEKITSEVKEEKEVESTEKTESKKVVDQKLQTQEEVPIVKPKEDKYNELPSLKDVFGKN